MLPHGQVRQKSEHAGQMFDLSRLPEVSGTCAR